MNTFKHHNYFYSQNECGIKVGDHVKVTRTAGDFEAGWDNSWTREMDEQVMETLQVIYIGKGKSGIELSDGYRYPFFVLEKVGNP